MRKRRRLAQIASHGDGSDLPLGFELSFDRFYSARLGEALNDPTVVSLVQLLLKHVEDQLNLRFSDLDLLLSILELFELLTPRLIG